MTTGQVYEVASKHCFDKTGWPDLPNNAAKLSSAHVRNYSADSPA